MRVALIAPDDFSIWVFRKQLLKLLRLKGHQVFAISSRGNYAGKLEDLGAIHLTINFSRFISPMQDLCSIIRLCNLFRKYQFDLVHSFTIKPNIYSALAGNWVGINQIFPSVTGLGFLSDENGAESSSYNLIRAFTRNIYFNILKSSTRIWFQNPDDMNFFVDGKIISRNQGVLIRSSGVDIEYFSPRAVNSGSIKRIREELGANEQTRFVMMVSRALRTKGVHEFLEASERIRLYYPEVRFVLVGDIEPGNPLSLSKEYLEAQRGSNFRWLGFRDDVRELFALADIAVLPSYYPEGVPRNLLEAMALAKPIITTDHVGCREVVEHGKNGFLIPIKDSAALADGVIKILSDKKQAENFGKYSRMKVEQEFDERVISERILSELYRWEV
jgi:N,N'-diacetylbacillosaminyl-diphospho-undecaprenol alpha-1,3-N-acetylgalactosaminyltransferase